MSGSFDIWYGNHREEFNAKRRARYAKDKKYRDRVQGYTRRNRELDDTPKKTNSDGTILIEHGGKVVLGNRMGLAATKLGVTPEYIRNLEKRNLIPPVGDLNKQHMRYYTDPQVTLIGNVITVRNKHMAGAATKAEVAAVVTEVKEGWWEL